MFEELDIIYKIQKYRDETKRYVKVQNYEMAAEYREIEISLLFDLCKFLKINPVMESSNSFISHQLSKESKEILNKLPPDKFQERKELLKCLDEYYRNKYGDGFEFPSTELIRQIKLDLLLKK